MKSTYHVYCKIRATTHYITVMAHSKEEAKSIAESRGHVVDRVRVAPSKFSKHPRR